MSNYHTDKCTYCGGDGHTVQYCQRKQTRGWTRSVGLAVMAIMLGTAIAQDAELTKEQQAAKCEAEGGCAMFTYDAFMGIIRAASEAAFKQGLQACNKQT